MSTVAETIGQDMLRMRVRGVLESIQAEEGFTEPIARIVFVQLARQAATRIGLRKWKSRTQGEQEAGEESLNRFLDGKWEYRQGVRTLENGNAQWVLHIWEVACEEWNKQQAKPKQLEIVEKPKPLSEQFRDAWRSLDEHDFNTAISELRRRENEH